jgi:hypothetical protein
VNNPDLGLRLVRASHAYALAKADYDAVRAEVQRAERFVDIDGHPAVRRASAALARAQSAYDAARGAVEEAAAGSAGRRALG